MCFIFNISFCMKNDVKEPSVPKHRDLHLQYVVGYYSQILVLWLASTVTLGSTILSISSWRSIKARVIQLG